MSLGVYNGVLTGMQNGAYAGTDIGVASGTATEFFDADIPRRNLLSYIDMGNRAVYPINSTGLLGRDLTTSTAGLTLVAPFTFEYLNKGCIRFPGTSTSQRLSTAFTTTIVGGPTSNFTFGGWFQVARMDGTKEGNFFNRGRDGSGLGWSLLVGTDANGFFRVGSVTSSPTPVGNVFTTTVQAALNTWYHILGIHENGVGLSIYVNGVFIGFQSFTGTSLRTSGIGWAWGANSANPGSQFDGRAAITYAWERILSPNEIMQVFLAHKQRFLKP
jgi:hypothetical protein